MDAQIKALLANISGMAKEVKALQEKAEDEIAKHLNSTELSEKQRAYFKAMYAKAKTGNFDAKAFEKEVKKQANGG